MRYRLPIVIVLLWTIACAGPAEYSTAAGTNLRTLGPGDHDLTLDVGGTLREYRLYVPPGLEGAGKVPLVIVLHGGGGKAAAIEKMSRMDLVADANHFLVAYPTGTKGFGGGGTWNGGNCCGPAMNQHVDDVGFMSMLIDTLLSERSVDPARVYATGISNGAIMAYRLACELSRKIAAVAPVAGALMDEQCAPERPVPVLIFHGTGERFIPWDGGGEWKEGGPGARRPYPSVSQSQGFWLRHDQCPSATKVTYRKGDVACTAAAPCAAGSEVVLCRIEGGGHSWPGGVALPQWMVGPTTQDISASEAMWKFFERHPMR